MSAAAPPLHERFLRTRGWTRPLHRDLQERAVLPAHAGMSPVSARSPSRRTGTSRVCGDGPVSSCLPPSPRLSSRACGDGPIEPCRQFQFAMHFPRTQGWTLAAREFVHDLLVLSTYVGMDPSQSPSRTGWTRAPHACGGGSFGIIKPIVVDTYFRHMRGWTDRIGAVAGRGLVLPAYAGMNPPSETRSTSGRRTSRVYGDGPRRYTGLWYQQLYFPRTRGWASSIAHHAVLHERAGRGANQPRHRGVRDQEVTARGR